MAMENRALKRVEPWFGPLLQLRGFEVVETHNSASFGDSFAVVEAENFRLRFVIDRDQTSVEIAASAKPESWHDLNLVRRLIEGASIKEPLETPDLAVFLEANLDEVNNLFKEKNLAVTETALKKLERERAEEMFPQAFRDPPRAS